MNLNIKGAATIDVDFDLYFEDASGELVLCVVFFSEETGCETIHRLTMSELLQAHREIEPTGLDKGTVKAGLKLLKTGIVEGKVKYEY